MNNYKVDFRGRESGAIGITYTMTVLVQAKDEEEALNRLYDKYEQIQNPIFANLTDWEMEKWEEARMENI